MSNMKIKVDVAKFKEQLKAKADEMDRATRPAAQAGAEIVYQRAKVYVLPISKHAHMFHGTNAVYGPYSPGTLRDSIYQAFSEDNSFKDVSTYHISWNADEAPYGGMVEFGTSHTESRSFIGRAVKDTRREVREAMKARFIAEVGG